MPCVDGKNLVYQIKELPNINKLEDDSELIVIDEQAGAPTRLKATNMMFTEDNTTFGTTIEQHTNDIKTLKEEIPSLATTIVDQLGLETSTINGVTTYKSIEKTKIKLIHIGTNVDSVQYGSTNISHITKSVDSNGHTIYKATSNVDLGLAYGIQAGINTSTSIAIVSQSPTEFEFRVINLDGVDVQEYGAQIDDYNNIWVDGDLYDGVDGILMSITKY